MYRNLHYNNKDSVITEWTWTDSGEEVERKERFKPYIYIESTSDKVDAISIFDTKLKKLEFNTEGDRRNFVERTHKRIFYNIPVKQQYLLDKYQHFTMDEMVKRPLRTFFIDIEVYVHDTFPEADSANYPINAISIFDTKTAKFYTWGLKKDYDVNGVKDIGLDSNNVVYINCSTELGLVDSFLGFWEKNYPDLYTGWNCSTFDVPYIVNRTRRLLGEDGVKRLSPIGNVYSRLRQNIFEKYYNHWVIDGISDIDYLELYAKSEMNQHESYKLGYIGNLEGVDGKVEYEAANLATLADDDWNQFITYNIQDVNIMVKLEAKKRYLRVARAKAYRGFSPIDKALDSVPIVTGMIAKAALDQNQIIVTYKPVSESVKFDGGFVFKPTGKIHRGIVSFDVNSLYPNTMITLNTSPETKVGKLYENEEGYRFHAVTGKVYDISKEKLTKLIKDHNLIKTEANVLFSQNKRGICAKFLDDLYQERKRLRAEMAKTDDLELKEKLDIEQYLLKILLNSVYGVFGNKYFGLYDLDIATSVTLTGQSMIKKSTEIVKEYAKQIAGVENVDNVVVYGDSVTGDTPILLKNSMGTIEIKQINEISSIWNPYNNFKIDGSIRVQKEQSDGNGYLVWTSSGWSPLRRVIRHKVEKDIFRVKTHVGLVDVTEDHSLLDMSGTPIKPKDCFLTQELLHSYPPKSERSPKTHTEIYEKSKQILTLSKEEQLAFVYGYFYGDGSCGYYEYDSGIKYSWAINGSNLEYNNLVISVLKNIYDVNFKMNDTIASSGVYKIVPNYGDMMSLTMDYRERFYNKDKFKIVPTEILNASFDIKEAFICGYFLSDGYKCDNTCCKNLSFNNKGKIGLAGLIYLFNSLGYNYSINDRKDKFNNYRLLATTKKLRKPEFEVKDIYKIDKSNYSEFVYDLETDEGNFNTGTPLIVKNTDSNFFDFDIILKNMGIEFFKTDSDGTTKVTSEAIEVIDKVEQYLNDQINEWAKKQLNTNDPRYHFSREKICIIGTFLTKKNYILRVLNNEGVDCDKLVEKGVELVKSSHSNEVKELIRSVVNCIFYERGKSTANEIYVDAISKFKKLTPDQIAVRKNARDHEKWKAKATGLVYGKGTPIHHKGAIYYNFLIDELGLSGKYPKISTGQKIKYVYLTKNPYGISVISFPDHLPEEFGLVPDYDIQFKKMVTPLIQRCYDGCDWILPNVDKLTVTDLFEFLDI